MQNVPNQIVATFSIVGFDPETGELGVAVQSKFLGVGAVVPWAKSGVGAIATQSYANTTYGPEGLKHLEKGKSARETLELLINDDPDKDMRQVGIVDAKGNAATFTGKQCYEWAGGRSGKHYAAQGNILVGKETVDRMAETFEQTEGSLAERLLKALEAGQKAGGDKRGKQSAALYVVKEKGGYGGFNDRYIDLRVDDHPEPIHELIRIYKLQRLYFEKPDPANILEIRGQIREELEQELYRLGYLQRDGSDDQELFKALTSFIHVENFEERELEPGKMDREVLEYMKEKQP
ncbi:putative Ntn-hydrolase superfamily protein [Melghiribacillus thermohalophilus]|uniref:Putative Ntn-hydrolase superfamily protein n=1 Tax=Melghiribacillus thermohalophilus TaxID=1324956 RepID=A0A4R3N060_9BACI|nr:DUF1028 domain-containing protein [Melghiribacillus thermohalophilus]TCT19979.1 putative Ntn-hydrolase superfamily protein [Melghiribacillus thermohalophilus]